ncbi:MAG: hypothetical protein ACO1NW_17555 [Chitinophagaceae bacterium]
MAQFEVVILVFEQGVGPKGRHFFWKNFTQPISLSATFPFPAAAQMQGVVEVRSVEFLFLATAQRRNGAVQLGIVDFLEKNFLFIQIIIVQFHSRDSFGIKKLINSCSQIHSTGN